MPPIKCVDHYWNADDKAWTHKDTDSKVPAEAVQPQTSSAGSSDDWKEFCFVVVRKLPGGPVTRRNNQNQDQPITFKIVVKSPHLHKACKEVIGEIPGLSWNAEPVELDPHLLVAFFPKLEAHHAALESITRSDDEEQAYTTLGALLAWLRQNYRTTLHKLANLTAHGEVTYELLYGILVPGTILITRNGATGEPRAVRLLTHTHNDERYALNCEGIEAADPQKDTSRDDESDDGYEDQEQSSPLQDKSRAFGTYNITIYVRAFGGTHKINRLSVYPIQHHADPAGLRASLIKRGRKWASLNGVYHVHYRGLAGRHVGDSYIRYNVTSRIMADRGNFVRLQPNYAVPKPNTEQIVSQLPLENGTVWTHEVEKSDFGLTDDQLLLATPILYGFSLADKFWLEFNVQLVTPITWNPETFEALVLPSDRKTLLRSLIESHDSDSNFDDFVRGKGQGLVINLFGPPGVGKTLSAEATSEHIRRPLYVVGSGDLGISPSDLDNTLERIFDVATCWNAIVLIDEADVFLEQRSLHDMQRNAMVAVFLRHIEYYRGILFLTTNRITIFDEAFLSRIHVALHFNELTTPTKAQIWRTFLKKAGIADEEVSEDMLGKLADREINGRQIKNACRTATSLARSRKQQLSYAHLHEALNAMEEFVAEFAAMRA
ncbi:P-loop containing nucleoside triphosphate hydrolase protein [Dichomitus squalens LYAD-421 SS1]|uniref:P-loop containing nucleoside triphosphate hydrolase protein n=1 Tax=Dichomitus squalens (strain LYAD-421) TaxID=732165 RepID=R7SQ46_DICSQ|nr:P-loop containing nucleoside triphosphate hydrolase protein [Dichomitus squalens LYAD-421 SS1]EJF58309.1 P-loop containing nucleoside triphosphate hydrolase protein [Dichomitus squalens LYAD-421 SS1]